MFKKSVVFIAALVAILCAQCSDPMEPTKPSSNTAPTRTPAQLTTAELDLVESVNRFSFKLFDLVNKEAEPDKNLFISPLSVSCALGLALNGADGPTRDEMISTLELAGVSVDDANRAYEGLTSVLTQADPAVTFTIANSFWSRQGKTIQPVFIDISRDYFNARVEEIDLSAAWAADTINHWVDVNTNGKITKIVKPPLPGSMAALLLNALYFKASWTYPFDTTCTLDRPFRLADGSVIQCPTMYKETEEDYQLYPDLYTGRPITCFSNDLFQGVHLPYGDIGFRLTVLLPDTSLSVDSLLALMTEDTWREWQNLPTRDIFVLQMPKFKFEYETSLKPALMALGMSAAFNAAQADFSNLFVDGIGWIDEVKHKTFVQVDEKGTEAAAVTAISWADSLPLLISLDRPFLFIIHESVSGAILFMGKVMNPTLEN